MEGVDGAMGLPRADWSDGEEPETEALVGGVLGPRIRGLGGRGSAEGPVLREVVLRQLSACSWRGSMEQWGFRALIWSDGEEPGRVVLDGGVVGTRATGKG